MGRGDKDSVSCAFLPQIGADIHGWCINHRNTEIQRTDQLQSARGTERKSMSTNELAARRRGKSLTAY
jgi:hypothetical protein